MTSELAAASRSQILIEGVSIRFGGLQALDSLSVAIDGGQVKALIGPNGAGKSTFVNCLTGLVDMDAGRITIDGIEAPKPLLGRLVECGIARTFQNIRLFANLTVGEHVEIAHLGYLRSRRGRLEARGETGHRVAELLQRFGLADRGGRNPSELSYGGRRRLEIARALATRPKLLLLDEPAAGMVPSEQVELADMIREIAADGIAVILIEHHMDLVASVADEIIVLNFGKFVMKGTMDQVRRDPRVISAYLGSTAAAAE